jgi:hypothetical protein
MGPDIRGAEAGDVQEAVTYGEDGGMPPFGNYLCPNDLYYLTVYLQSLRKGTAPDFVHWWEPTPCDSTTPETCPTNP